MAFQLMKCSALSIFLLLSSSSSFAPTSISRRRIHVNVNSNLNSNVNRMVPNGSGPSKEFTTRLYASGYVPPPPEDFEPKERKLYPKIGDVVRYYDLDGGRADGQVLVGKISYISKKMGTSNNWIVEVAELENVGDGYYAEYPSRKRNSKKTNRPYEKVSPLAASFVRTESAYKVPRQLGTELPQVLKETYTLEGFEAYTLEAAKAISSETVSILEADAERYGALKFTLLRNAAIAGVVGTLLADLARGTQDAVIYAGGAFAGVLYLFFLSLKTDTVASVEAKLGSKLANLRFALPLILLVTVAIYNLSLGDESPVTMTNAFRTVTPEQFAATVLGFLTYRIPLFVSQLAPLVKESAGGLLPGSAGIAFQLANEKEKKKNDADEQQQNMQEGIPVLLVSGPPGTGRSELVKRLIADSNGTFVEPTRVNSAADGAIFEQMVAREQFLKVDEQGRYGITKENILTATANGADSEVEIHDSAVVVDADVELAKKLTSLPGARVIGVWVGLDSMEKFEKGIKAEIESGAISIPADETLESVIRSKKREIAEDIEYGVVSGVFEFTVLVDDFESSLEQLKFASQYCFK